MKEFSTFSETKTCDPDTDTEFTCKNGLCIAKLWNGLDVRLTARHLRPKIASLPVPWTQRLTDTFDEGKFGDKSDTAATATIPGSPINPSHPPDGLGPPASTPMRFSTVACYCVALFVFSLVYAVLMSDTCVCVRSECETEMLFYSYFSLSAIRNANANCEILKQRITHRTANISVISETYNANVVLFYFSRNGSLEF